eukprot:IDg16953t1
MTAPAFLARLYPFIRTSRTHGLCKMSAGGTSVSEEMFDLLNEDGSPNGVAKARSQVHRDGDLHRSTHIWVIARTSPPQLLLQKRAADKDTFPGLWDVSAAGHIAAGDQSLDSAQRELLEELGLRAGNGEDAELEKAFEARACNKGSTPKHGAFIDNELQDVYILRRDGDIKL